jgi:hypothetical protein
MNRLRNILIAVIAITSLSTSAFAGSYGIGIAGHVVGITVDGSETPGAGPSTEDENSVTNAQVGNFAGFGSIFAEVNLGETERFTLGIDYVPFSAEVSRDNMTRREANGATIDNNDDDGLKSAQAELKDHITYYAEAVITNGIFVKYGFSQVDIDIQQTVQGLTSTYGDKTLDAITYGLGQKGTFGDKGFYKVEGYYTDYDNYSATGAGCSTDGTSTCSQVQADLDVVGAALRVGYKF